MKPDAYQKGYTFAQEAIRTETRSVYTLGAIAATGVCRDFDETDFEDGVKAYFDTHPNLGFDYCDYL